MNATTYNPTTHEFSHTNASLTALGRHDPLILHTQSVMLMYRTVFMESGYNMNDLTPVIENVNKVYTGLHVLATEQNAADAKYFYVTMAKGLVAALKPIATKCTLEGQFQDQDTQRLIRHTCEVLDSIESCY